MKTTVRWFGGHGHWTSRDGHWCIARLQYRRPARYLVIETSDRYLPHPDFATIGAAKAFVDAQEAGRLGGTNFNRISTPDGVGADALTACACSADDDGVSRCPSCGVDLATDDCRAGCERVDANQPPSDSDREPDDYPWDDQRDDRVKQALGEPNYSEAEPAGLDDPMSWER